MPPPNSPKLSEKAIANFPLARKRGDRVADLLRLGERELVAADPGDEALDPRVVAGRLDRIEKIAQGRLGADDQFEPAALVGAVGEALGQIDREDDVAGECGRNWA